MLKKRLIASILVKDGIAVQSIGFRRFLPLGRPEILAENLNRWGADEILLLDISAPREGRGPDLALLNAVAAKCFVPLALGGGIAGAESSQAVIVNGGDKVVVNSAALRRPAIIGEIVDCLGSQCVVGSIDAVVDAAGGYRVASRAAREVLTITPEEAARGFADAGAGEILITAVARDGGKRGFDLDLIARVAAAVDVPVIANAGAGHPMHFGEVLSVPGVSAAAAGNYFSFTEHSILTTKAWLAGQGVELRADTYGTYAGRRFDADGRLAKLPDEVLADLLFQHYPEEVI